MSSTYNFLGIEIHRKNPEFVNTYSKSLLEEFYLRPDEPIPQALARPAIAFCYGDYARAQRIYDYAYKNWFMYSSPQLSNAPKGVWQEDPSKEGAHYWHKSVFIPHEKANGQAISCYAFTAPDTAQGQKNAIIELADLSMSGGGVGVHNMIRGVSKKAPGPVPFMKAMDGAIGYFKQGGTRKGALCYYVDVDHPDIIEHIDFRVEGGDRKRRSDNVTQFHCGVNLTDAFIHAVLTDGEYDLKCPHSGKVYETRRAREVWERILDARELSGEPMLLKIDLANRRMPKTQKDLGLRINGSNLCSEITLPTDELRTFVCCLCSLNLDKYDEWKDSTIVEDLIWFLDSSLQFFIDNAPDYMSKAKYSAERERALGLGTFGWHSLLQRRSIPFEGGGFGSSVQLTHEVHSLIKERATKESRRLAVERGEAPDMVGTGLRNSRLTAIAPNANSADISGASPSREPWYRNVFVKKTRAGVLLQKNPHLESLLEQRGFNSQAVWNRILADRGSVQNLEFLTDHEKQVYKTAVEIDQHWVIELAEQAGRYICQAQSLNVFMPKGASKEYVNSVHLKYLVSPNVLTMYYYRTEREIDVDTAKAIERKALKDWVPSETGEAICVACQG